MRPSARSTAIEAQNDLLSIAEQASRNAYSPYSNFAVGAAVRTKTGNIYTACNVENVSYSVTTCAERNALAAAIAAEGTKLDIAEIAVAAFNAGQPAPCSPCGACRQAIAELAPRARVSFFGEGMSEVEAAPSELLPGAFAFDPMRG